MIMPRKRKTGLTIDEAFAPVAAPAPVPVKRQHKLSTPRTATVDVPGSSRKRIIKISRGNPNPRTDQLKPWKPGQSGNPAGRPRSTTEMKQRAAASTENALEVFELTVQLAAARLRWAVGVLNNPDAPPEDVQAALLVSMQKPGHDAAQHLLDRGHGKPQQKLEVDIPSELEGLSDDELDAHFIALVKVEVDDMTKRKAKNGKK